LRFFIDKIFMKLSFIIPAYNEERYIGDCLAAIINALKQTRQEAEIIVVNNASTDKTAEIAGQFAGVKIVNEPKKGLTHARQAGYLASTGDILANIDADTLVDEKWITAVLKEFSDDENLIGLSGPFIYHNLSKIKRIVVKFYYLIGYLTYLINSKILKNGSMMQGGNFAVRKTALDKINGFNLNIQFYGEDTDIAVRLSKIGKVKFTFNLPIKTSSRRLEKEGIIATGWRYALNYLSVILFKTPANQNYKDIR